MIKPASDIKKSTSWYEQTAYYPWQQPVWQQLFTAHTMSGKVQAGKVQADKVQADRIEHFPHALLLSGVSGIGKKDLAFYLAKALLCQTPQTRMQTQQLEPCNQCRSCQLFSAGNHPDLYHLTIPEDKKVIPVDDVRDLIQWGVLNSQLDGKKVIIIEPAEAMNLNAANSLLKTLEEPVSDTIIILLTNKKQALLPTIRSRCQTIDLPLPESDIALQWLIEQGLIEQGSMEQGLPAQETEQAKLMLSLASGAPLMALNLAQSKQLEVRSTIINQFLSILTGSIDPVQAAESLSKQISAGKSKKPKKNLLLISAYDVIYWIDSIVSDLARLEQKCSQNTISNIDQYQNLQQLSHRLNLKNLLQLSELINKAYYDIQGQINVNLLLEKLFIDWQNCKK